MNNTNCCCDDVDNRNPRDVVVKLRNKSSHRSDTYDSLHCSVKFW